MPGEAAARLPRRRTQPRPTWQRLLEQVWQLTGGTGELRARHEQSWASATFAGARHGFTLRFVGPRMIDQAEHLIAALPEHEFRIPGQIVVDAAVCEVHHDQQAGPWLELSCELLLVEDS